MCDKNGGSGCFFSRKVSFSEFTTVFFPVFGILPKTAFETVFGFLTVSYEFLIPFLPSPSIKLVLEEKNFYGFVPKKQIGRNNPMTCFFPPFSARK